jgi:hypothetical protein
MLLDYKLVYAIDYEIWSSYSGVEDSGRVGV